MLLDQDPDAPNIAFSLKNLLDFEPLGSTIMAALHDAATTREHIAPSAMGLKPAQPGGPPVLLAATTACGSLFEAMKWEKRVETNMTGYAQWFVDSRGWGDLVEGTSLEWPVPYQELFARVQPTYTTSTKAVKGTYGF